MLSACVRLVQLSDFHLGDRQDSSINNYPVYPSFEKLFHLALSLHPDHILCTGDLVDQGELAGYELLAQVFNSSQVPVSILYGNHDRPCELMNRRLQKVFVLGNWQILCLDSIKPSSTWGEGRLSTSELNWLQESLANLSLPTLIALHHHPIVMPEPELSWLNLMHLENQSEFLEIIANFLDVKAVICGHIHREIMMNFHHFKVLTCPSTCYQVSTANEAVPSHWAGLRVLDLHPDGSFSTQVVRCHPDFDEKSISD